MLIIVGPSHDSFMYFSSPAHGWSWNSNFCPQKSQPAINHRGLWVGGLVWHVAPLVAQFTSVAVALVKGQAQGLVIITWGELFSSSALVVAQFCWPPVSQRLSMIALARMFMYNLSKVYENSTAGRFPSRLRETPSKGGEWIFEENRGQLFVSGL